MRLQKWLSQLGIASRREAERWIEQGRLVVNDQRAEIGCLVDPSKDRILLDGEELKSKTPPKVYWLLNKPDRVLTSRPVDDGRDTIYDLESLAKLPFLVSPVGRLDFRTEGLLLLSNDGEWVHRLTHPSYKVPRHYYALVQDKLSAASLSQLRKGLELDDGMVAGIDIEYAHGQKLGGGRGSWYFVTVHEGRNRLVRRLFEKLGHEVARLVRFGFGDLRLPEDLPPGQYRQLAGKEIRQLKKAVGLLGERR